MNCSFYLLKAGFPTAYQGYRHTPDENNNIVFEKVSGYIGIGLVDISAIDSNRRLIQLPPALDFEEVEVLEADSQKKLIKKTILARGGFLKLARQTNYFTLNFIGASYKKIEGSALYYLGYLSRPHYKKLALKYSKEPNQIFFRKALEGKITLHEKDFRFVANANLEDRLLFNLYRFDKLESTNVFNKSDCKIDWEREQIELKVSPEDRYTNILNALENTYDLIKCAPALTPLQLSKRMVYQVYQAGGNTITNYFSGTYYENEVQEVIDDEQVLQNTYHFTKLKSFTEVTLKDFNYGAINSVYSINGAKTEWRSRVHKYVENGVTLTGYGTIKLEQTAAVGDFAGYADINDTSDSVITGRRLSDNAAIPVASYVEVSTEDDTPYYRYLYNMYKIVIYENDSRVLYISSAAYADTLNGTDYSISGLVEGGYAMVQVVQPGPFKRPTPAAFNLSDFAYTRDIYARCLADVEKYTDSKGVEHTLFDLPYDDFAVSRGNYKKCIGLSGLNIWQSDLVQAEPTKYGINDFGEYFSSNFIPAQYSQERPLPVARSNWGNTSLWITEGLGYKELEKNMRKNFVLKDAYSLEAVISALLAKIDKNITFEATPEYSSFLYGSPTEYHIPTGYAIYITPKSNILKGDYDQAARKAEITFKNITDMLCNCFRCYWFIDEQNRFRIEHISYFSEQSPKFNLTQKFDAYTKKSILFAQKELAYNKNDLPARYEFNWMDDCTDLFGNFTIDIKSEYVQKDKSESIAATEFSSDIDLMMLFPEKFSEDGFALIIASSATSEVPIVLKTGLKDEEFRHTYDAEVQNYFASWLYLANYYMYDMPAKNIAYSSLADGSLRVQNVKRIMSNEITCPVGFSLDPDFPVISTFGKGLVDSLEVDVDTEQATFTLLYMPE